LTVPPRVDDAHTFLHPGVASVNHARIVVIWLCSVMKSAGDSMSG
jgi:hypothetical protein